MVEAKGTPQASADAIGSWLFANDEVVDDPNLRFFLDAAAVLSCFAPEELRSTERKKPETDTAIALVDRSARVSGTKLRQLRDADRESAIGRLGSRDALKRARSVNAGGDDPLQRGIDTLIDSTSAPDLSGLSLADLLGLQQAVRWLTGVSDLRPPDPAVLTEQIERERVLQPMRRLVANGFVGRDPELAQLRSYVGVLPPINLMETPLRIVRYASYRIEDRPPLFLFGPGGVGKSTLLAKFILDHAALSPTHKMPFIYLDFDRGSLDPTHTHTLMIEAVSQIRAQFPELIDGEHLEGVELIANFEDVQISKGAHFGRTERLIERLASLLGQLAKRNNQPVLLVLDTFEEAQTQGSSAILSVWRLLGQLMARVDRIRIVVAGRRNLPSNSTDFPHEPVEVTSLDEATSVHFLEMKTRNLKNGPIGRGDAKAIFDLVKITADNGRPGAVPLSLALAARIVMREGLEALKDTVGRRRLFARITAEQQQGMLNTRVLQHLQGTDPDLRKLVDPGLIVRRITPAIIRGVLAGPCGIVVADDTRARELFEALTLEWGLVDGDREPGAVWHLPTVRRAMLPLLKGTLGEAKLRAIHDVAVAHYEGEKGIVSRAEEMFHRLSRGDPAHVLDPKWIPELVPLLRSAYDELDGPAKLWLAGKLGVEVDDALRARADLGDWERQAGIRARSFLLGGFAGEALAALRERPERTEASVLPALEADALLLLGRPTEARDVVLAALQHGETVANADTAAALLTRLTTIDERGGRFADALQAAEDAIASSRLTRDTLTEIGAGSAVLRLRRKLNLTTPDSDTTALVEMASRADMRSALRQNPAVLRELAAAVGPASPGIIADALEVLGIDRETLIPIAGDLHRLVRQLPGTERLAELLVRLLGGQTGLNIAGLGREFASLLRRTNSREPDLVRILAGTIAANVQTSVDQVIRAQPSGIAVGRQEERSLADAISSNLTPDAFRQLVYAVLDVDLDNQWPSYNSYQEYVESVVQSLAKANRLTPFLEGILRSPVVDPTLRVVAARLLAQRGALDQADLQIDLNDLNGLQREELTKTILSVFGHPRELDLLLATAMDRRLAHIVRSDVSLTVQVRDLIAVSQREGWTDKLIAALQAEFPSGPLVSSLVSRLTALAVEGDRNLISRSLERTIAQQSAFVNVFDWTSALTTISGQVCRIETSNMSASGLLVGPDLVLTAFHVVKRLLGDEQRQPFVCRFDYWRDMPGQSLDVAPAGEWLVHSSPYGPADLQRDGEPPTRHQLDYALIRLSSAVGSRPGQSGRDQRGWIDVGRRREPLQAGETLFILQHPAGQMITVGRILALNVNGTRVQYDASAAAGSSGGPCFDASFNLIALHHAAFSDGARVYNEGIPIGLIVDDLRRAGIELPAPDSNPSEAMA